LESHDHVAWVGDGQTTLNRLARSFFAAGVGANERMMLIVENPDPGRLAGLEGLDALLASGQLTIASVDDVYQGGTDFDPNQQLAIFTEVLDESLAAGYQGIRVLADNTPLVRGGELDFHRWLAWEQLTDRFQAQREVLGLCYFDRRQLPADRLDDLLAIHPVHSPSQRPPLFSLFNEIDGLNVTGEIDIQSQERFRRVLDAAPIGEEVVFDFGEAHYVDHRALMALAEIARNGATVRIRRARPIVQRLWECLDQHGVNVHFEPSVA
jgi:anti-anti-sigma regulatory factor